MVKIHKNIEFQCLGFICCLLKTVYLAFTLLVLITVLIPHPLAILTSILIGDLTIDSQSSCAWAVGLLVEWGLLGGLTRSPRCKCCPCQNIGTLCTELQSAFRLLRRSKEPWTTGLSKSY